MLWIAAEIVYLKAPPYELPVQRLVDFKQPGHRVDPELVVAVPFQDRVGDSPVHLAVQVFRRNLKQKTQSQKTRQQDWRGVARGSDSSNAAADQDCDRTRVIVWPTDASSLTRTL